MGFYGNLYTNLTTFFHNFKFKGPITNQSAITFPEQNIILEGTNEDFSADQIATAHPEVVYDNITIEAGNRWIQFVPMISSLDNPDGTKNYNGISIYHGPPSGVEPSKAQKIEDGLNFQQTIEEEQLYTSVADGGYLSIQQNKYDEAGHLQEATIKTFELPNVTEVKNTADQAKADIENLQIKVDGIDTRLGQAESSINTINETIAAQVKNINTALSNSNDALNKSNDALEIANNQKDSIDKAVAGNTANTALLNNINNNVLPEMKNNIQSHEQKLDNQGLALSTEVSNSNYIKTTLTAISNLFNKLNNGTYTSLTDSNVQKDIASINDSIDKITINIFDEE